MSGDFISNYLQYRADTEPPKIFHRWSIISALGAYLGRNCWVQLGEAKIHPNQFVMLIGAPGTRKSTAIKLAKKLIKAAGYNTFSADKTSKEKFIIDLYESNMGLGDGADNLEQALFGDDTRGPAEVYIACDEFNNFIGNGNTEFISLLGEWWDIEGFYEYRTKSSKNIAIKDPTISILGGNTPSGFNLAFPPEIIGQGFFSRLLLVHGEESGVKITFPEAPSASATQKMIDDLVEIKTVVQGEMMMSADARELLDHIYKNPPGIDDARFENYFNRRFTHLLKLGMVVAAARKSNHISLQDVVYANTILVHTESSMPKALGEFGRSRNATVTHKILTYLENTPRICTMQDIWKQVSTDMEKQADLGNVLNNLYGADKIMRVDGGFIAKKKVAQVIDDGSVNYDLLTKQETRGKYEFGKLAIVS